MIPLTAFAQEGQDNDRFRFYQIFASEKQWYPTECDMAKNSNLRSKVIQTLRLYGYSEMDSRLECAQVTGKVIYDKNEGDQTSTFGLTLEESIKKGKSWGYDLLIIVFDNKFSKQYYEQTYHLKENKPYIWLGHIQYDTKTIVTGTHLEESEDDKATQTIVHEVSHFQINKIYNRAIAGDAVHKADDEFDDCLERGLPSDCSHVWTYLKTHGSPVPVMSPDYVMKVAESMKPKSYTPPTSNTPKTPSHSSNLINQLISDYGDKKNEIKSTINSMKQKYQNLSFDSPLAKAKHGYVMNELRKVNFESNDYNVNVAKENWNKQRHSIGENGVREEIKELYGIANDLRQLDREIIKAKELERGYEKKSDIVESSPTTNFQFSKTIYAKVKVSSIQPETPFSVYANYGDHSSRDGEPTFTLFKKDSGNWKEIITVNGKFAYSGWFEGNFGNSKHYSNGEYKIEYLFPDYKSKTIQKGTTFFEIKNEQSNLNTQKEISSQSSIPSNTNKEQSKHAELKLKHEVQDLQKKSYEKLNSIKNELENTKVSLEKLSSNSADQKEKINKSWNILKKINQDIEKIEEQFSTGDRNVGKERYENAKAMYTLNERDSSTQSWEQMKSNLNKISNIVEEVSPKTCFLMWCW